MELSSINNKDRKNRRKPSLDLTTMVYGKVPPQAKELEEAVLGAIMLEKTAFDTVIEILKSECFYVDAHQRIFKAFMAMGQKSMPIDILTTVQQLQSTEELDTVGGPYAVTKLTNSVVGAANIEAHARIILQKFIQRELIRISGEIINDSYEDSSDVFDLLDDAESKIFTVSNAYLKKNFEHVTTAGMRVSNRIDKMRKSDEMLSGVPSGFPSLDRITYGWQPTDLIILAARPSVGKTALALNLARNACLDKNKPTPVGMFSLEMSIDQLVSRILSAESEIPLENISRGKMDESMYTTLHRRGFRKLNDMEIYVDDTAALNIFELRAKARRMVNKHKVGLIIIDYLQLMSGNAGKGGNREQEISTISRNLKALAKELVIPIIALSQLSRAVETRKESKIPQLSDLRESGAIEQDADMVMFIYRPEYYEQKADAQGDSTQGLTEIKIAKHRNGTLETIKLRALLHIQKFLEWNGPLPTNAGSWKPVPQSTDFSEGFRRDEEVIS